MSSVKEFWLREGWTGDDDEITRHDITVDLDLTDVEFIQPPPVPQVRQ